MRLIELTRYNIPVSLIEGWRQRQGDILLPLQSEALRQGLLADGPTDNPSLAGRSLLISAPTSTGKTFCGELALAGAIVQRLKGVLLVPLKSIAEEKFAEFESLYKCLNLKCIIATADHPEYSGALVRGEFDIAICVYEKFNQALLSNIDLLGRLGALVIDEAQLLTDPERGMALESILLKLTGYRQASALGSRTTNAGPRLIALTASLATDSALAERFDAQLIRETRRPVELRLGVLFAGNYRYFNRETGEVGYEEYSSGKLMPFDAEQPPPIAPELLQRLSTDSGPTLVFLSERWRVIGAALALAACGRWRRAEKSLADLTGEEPSSVVRALCQSLTCGVAFHSADLTASQRRVIEQGFRSGEISVIFCTTTLGLGVNLPAETVYIEPFKYSASALADGGGRQKHRLAGLAPLPRAEFENIAGRAGRYHCQISSESQPQVARAVLIAQTEFERDVLWGTYIEPTHAANSRLSLIVDASENSEAFTSLVLEMIVCGLASNLAQLASAFVALARSSNDAQSQKDQRSETLNNAVNHLRELDLLIADTDKLVDTDLGQAVGGSGLSLRGVSHFVNALQRIQPTSAQEWLALALSSPDFFGSGPIATRTAAGAVARQLFTSLPDSADRLLACLTGGAPVPSPVSVLGASRLRAPELIMRIRAFLVLEAWRSGEWAHLLETRCRISVAQVSRLGQDVRWLMRSLVDIAVIVGVLTAESAMALELDSLMDSLRYGLPAPALELGQSLAKKSDGSLYQLTDLFNRAELMELENSGCRTASDVAELLETSGAKVLPNTSINPAVAFAVKQRRLQARLAALGQTPAPSGACSRLSTAQKKHNTHNSTHSNKQERNMSEQIVAGHQAQAPLLYPATSAGLTVGKTAQASSPIVPGLTLVPCSLQIDGASRGERFLMRVDGLPVSLTGKSFKYLVKLVCARLAQADGWIYKDDIEIGFNQARYLYRMRREIAAQLPSYSWSVYENNRLGYYRLALDSAAISVNREALVNSPDYEIAQAAAALAIVGPIEAPVDRAMEERRLG